MIRRKVDKKKVAREIEAGSTAIASIPNDLKPSAQTAELNKFIAEAKREMSKGKSLVLVSISSDRVTQD